MKFRINTLLPLLVLFFATGSGLFSAESDKMDGSISVTLAAVTVQDPQLEQLSVFYKNDGKWAELNVPSVKGSLPWDYRGPALIEFFREPYAAAEAKPTPIATAQLTPGSRQQMLVFFHGDGMNQIRVLALEDDADGFPNQSLKFVNLSRVEVIARLNGGVNRLSAGERLVEPFGDKGGRGFRMQCAVQRESNGEWKLVYSRGLPIFPTSRWLVLWLGDGADPWLLMLRNHEAPRNREASGVQEEFR